MEPSMLEEKKAIPRRIYTALWMGVLDTAEESAKEEEVSAMSTRGMVSWGPRILGYIRLWEEGHVAHEQYRAPQSYNSINNNHDGHLLSYWHVSGFSCTTNISIL